MRRKSTPDHRQPNGSPRPAPGGGVGRRRWPAWLGLFVLLFNLLAAPAIGLGHNGAFAAELDGAMVICTSQGMLVLDADGKSHPPADSSDHDGICVFCLPLMQGGSLAPVADMVVLPPSVTALLVEAPTSQLPPLPGIARKAHPARAPPASV
jgi:hypothetical protein